MFPPHAASSPRPGRQTRDFHILNVILALQNTYVQRSQLSIGHHHCPRRSIFWHHSSRSSRQSLSGNSDKLLIKPASGQSRAAQAREQQTRTLAGVLYSAVSKSCGRWR